MRVRSFRGPFVLISSFAAAGIAGLGAQDGLRPVHPGGLEAPGAPDAPTPSALTETETETPGAPDPVPVNFERGHWIEGLQVEDLDRREANLAGLIDLALVDPAARGLIDELVAGSGELAWTARLARRELDLRARRGVDAIWTDPLGNDLFENEIFPPFGSQVAPLSGLGTPSPFDMLEDLQGELDARFAPDAGMPGGGSVGQSFSMRIGPDGVELELRSTEDGEESIKTYRGDDLEALLGQQPEQRPWVSGAPGGLTPLDQRHFRGQRLQAESQPLRTDILGVLVTDSPATATRPAGLVVHDTVPGTIAHLIGITSGDLLLEINANPLVIVTDISRAMGARGDEGEVRVRMIGVDGVERTRVWRPVGS